VWIEAVRAGSRGEVSFAKEVVVVRGILVLQSNALVKIAADEPRKMKKRITFNSERQEPFVC